LTVKWSSDAALRAVRAAVIVPGLFAITLEGIGNLQMATLTAFGGFATLVLASFGGSRRDKLVAHAALALAGSVLLVIGTAVGTASSAAVGAVVTVPVAFAVFYAGIAGPNAASAATAALLAYVLPAASAGPMSVVGDRLVGWLLASVVGTAAVLASSPRQEQDPLRSAASRLAARLADQLDAALGGTATSERLQAAIDAKHELLARFGSAVYKPTGLAAPAEALASAIELLEWCTSMVADMATEGLDLRRAAEPDRELFAAATAVLRDTSALLAGGAATPDLERIGRIHGRCLSALLARPPDGGDLRDQARISFHANAIALAVRTIGADAVVAAELADSEWFAGERRRLFGISASGSLVPRRASRLAAVARRDASLGSVWLINSLRGAIALAAAVAVADLASLQHGFWVVLGTLSVLRTNAASTGATALRALTGTAIGFVIGGALLLAIGAGSGALWAVLPVAVLVAAYAPGTLPFAVGQAGFTVTVAVLFNLLVPVGWKVGVVRVEDVAIGSAVSVLVGSLVWPHGVGRLVARDLGEAFRSGAAYLGQAVAWAVGSRQAEPDNTRPALDAGLRLADAVRGFLAERGTKELSQRDLWLLLGGSVRLRLTAHGIAELPGDAVGNDAARGVLQRRTQTLTSWYDRLAQFVGGPLGRPLPALSAPRFAPEDIVDESSGSLYGIWLCEHLDHLSEHLADLVPPAERILETRRKPWWR
jgi:uncharacterized membrane protein YccC